MAISVVRSEWRPEVGRVFEFIADTETDVSSLPQCKPSSTALVCATGNVYIVNASGQWVKFGGEA